MKSAFWPAAIGNGLAGRGERAETASGEKNANAGPPSKVENETVSPLTTGTEPTLETRIPPLLMSVISVCAITTKLMHLDRRRLLLSFFQRGQCGNEFRIAAKRRKLRAVLEFIGVVAGRDRLRDERNCRLPLA